MRTGFAAIRFWSTATITPGPETEERLRFEERYAVSLGSEVRLPISSYGMQCELEPLEAEFTHHAGTRTGTVLNSRTPNSFDKVLGLIET